VRPTANKRARAIILWETEEAAESAEETLAERRRQMAGGGSTWWSLDDALDDLSDICRGPDGHIYVLSDQSACIARLGELDPEGGAAEIEQLWHLADIENAEGLVVLDDFTPLVAVDQRSRRGNLLVLSPLVRKDAAVESRGRWH